MLPGLVFEQRPSVLRFLAGDGLCWTESEWYEGDFFFYALHPGCLGNVSMYPYVCVYFSYLGISFSSLLLPIGFLESDIYFYAKA